MKQWFLCLVLAAGVMPAAAWADFYEEETETEIELQEYILGYWGTSEESFSAAETSGQYVEVQEDGVLRFFELSDSGEEERMTFDWVLEDNILYLYSEGELVIEATIEIQGEGMMIWTNQHGEKLYLIVGAG